MVIVDHECYVSFDVAKLLEQAGFDWKCKTYFDASIYLDETIIEDELRDYNFMNGSIRFSAPTLDVAQRWLREVKGFEVFVGFTKHDFGKGNEKAYFYSCYEIPENEDAYEHYEDKYYHFYEEAQEACIKNALDVILEKRTIIS